PPHQLTPPEEFSKEDVLDYYQGEIQSVRTFCEEKGLVTIPLDIGDCRVVETPKFLLGLLPGIAYMPPPPFDSFQTGYFYVSPIPSEFTEEDRQHYYSIVKNREFRGGVVHEVYPGHHLQLSLSNRFPSKVRVYQQSNLFAEGWALYCEELMVDEGLYEEKWDVMEELARWIRFRAARVILDVKLQSGDFDYDSAVNFLVEEFGEEDREYFEKEVKRYCLSPTQPMSCLVGKLQISDLRKKVEKLMGEDFSLQRFHDLLLSEGTIPLKLVERKILHRLKDQ
ncbi:DUF885 domain-containing protein, partial [candidate division TA06 bacterium]|nr:DUF885 domain-containing protein [candidate division TA06 bacterium]